MVEAKILYNRSQTFPVIFQLSLEAKENKKRLFPATDSFSQPIILVILSQVSSCATPSDLSRKENSKHDTNTKFMRPKIWNSMLKRQWRNGSGACLLRSRPGFDSRKWFYLSSRAWSRRKEETQLNFRAIAFIMSKKNMKFNDEIC